MPSQHAKRQLNVRLEDEVHDLLDRLAERHGGKAAALEHAVRLAMGANEPTDAELLDMLRARLARPSTPHG